MENKKIKILSVNTSEKRGRKFEVKELVLDKNGVINDAHSGPWNRQISIISKDHVDQFKRLTECRKIDSGEFAENIFVDNMEDVEVKEFDRFIIGNVELEVTQIGKPFHDKFRELGNYVMPRVGIFCRVVKPGTIKPGDFMTHKPKTFNILVVTLSDRASRGEYEDISGPTIVSLVNDFFVKKNKSFKIELKIIPDNAKSLTDIINNAKNNKTDVIITTGGTGIGPRDITVETVKPMLKKEIPGIMEMIRLKYGMQKPNALLSLGVAGVIEKSLIYTLPGSVKAVKEYMSEILKTLDHLIYMLHGIDAH